MALYKPMADLLVVAPPRKTVEEVTARELNKDTAGVLARVGAGARAIITKHGAPVAVLMEVEEAVGLCGTVLLRRREAERRLSATTWTGVCCSADWGERRGYLAATRPLELDPDRLGL